MPKKSTRGSMLADAFRHPASEAEKSAFKRNHAIAASNDLLLPDELDLTPLQGMSVPELLQQIDDDVRALDELELHVYRHVVRIAACIKELRDRDERQASEAGKPFSKTEWNRYAQEHYFQSRLAKSQMYTYQKLARPENHGKAREFQQKIQTVRELRQTYEGNEEIFSSALENAGISRREADLLPGQFSISAFERYLKAASLPSLPQAAPSKSPSVPADDSEPKLVGQQKRLLNRLHDAELRYFASRPILAQLDSPEAKATLKDVADIRRQIARAIDEYLIQLERGVAQIAELQEQSAVHFAEDVDATDFYS